MRRNNSGSCIPTFGDSLKPPWRVTRPGSSGSTLALNPFLHIRKIADTVPSANAGGAGVASAEALTLRSNAAGIADWDLFL
jgi:hypothetical protein